MKSALAFLLLILAGLPAAAGSLTLPTVTFTGGSTPPSTIQKPGPSAALFASPYYSCVHNVYVASNGSDSNTGTQASPWLTLQHANDSIPNPAPGYCVNVSAGTYNKHVTITHGGNQAAATGYVAYRCAAMDACKITDTATAFNFSGSNTAAYVMIDGFEMASTLTGGYDQGVRVYDENGDSTFVTHHVWVLNSVIHGYSQSGLQLNDGEYFYVLHNKVYNNSLNQCGARGSGISLAGNKAKAGYAQTGDDVVNPNPLIGTLTPFHNVVAWNVVYANNNGSCALTDGNGINMDTWANTASYGMYPNKSLIAFNVVYNNGGFGIGLTWADHFVVANNSVYNSAIDPLQTGSYRPGIGSQNNSNTGHDHTYLNNISVAISGSGNMARNSPFCFGETDPTAMNNVSIGAANSWCGAQLNAATNKVFSVYSQANVNSYFSNVGQTSVGNKDAAPVGANFALPAGSPAIGYGMPEPYLSSQSIDAGACHHSLATCP